jgi:predicted nucleic acid-binding protein
VVADASPLQYLVLIKEVQILRALYGRVLTPPAVVKELSQPRTPKVVSGWIAEPPDWLGVRTLSDPLAEFPTKPTSERARNSSNPYSMRMPIERGR